MSDAGSSPLPADRYTTLRRLVEAADTRLVVSFGGGSLAGLCGNLALASILEELALKEHVEEIWGTSAGAVIGAGWACGTPAADILGQVHSLDRPGALDFRLFRFACGILASLWPLRRPLPDGLIGGEQFLQAIKSGLRVEKIEDCIIPFRCIACSDDGLARTKVFRRGDLLHAVFASMSIPGVVTPRPVPRDGNCYYDGGLVEKTPLISPIAEHLRQGDQRQLLLLGTHFGTEANQGRARGFLARFLQTLYALENLAWDYQLREARARENITLLMLNPRLGETKLFDFARTLPIYAAAREKFAGLLQNDRIGTLFGGR